MIVSSFYQEVNEINPVGEKYWVKKKVIDFVEKDIPAHYFTVPSDYVQIERPKGTRIIELEDGTELVIDLDMGR